MRSSRFSPRSLEHTQLERLTVAREDLLTRLQTAVSGAVVSGQARFDLVLGPRGAGKSHIIGVLEGRLRASPELLERTVIVAPPEELHPLTLVHFLALLLGEFPDDPELGPSADALRSLQRQRDPNQERRAVDLIRARLAGRSLIILLENLDELFTTLGRDGQQRLRNILQTERRWSIIASSRSLSPAFTKYEAPFHGTFNLHRLAPLSPEQCRDMLVALADAHANEQLSALLRTPKGLARVRGLHHLLGGNPRAMAFLFRQLDEHRLDHFELALADLADELEPYFQEQMTRLSPTQRAIMELLAESWRPLTVTELSELGFTAQATTSNALRHLRGEALVQVLEVGRERYYELGDPLLRLARANQRPRDAIAAFARVIRWWYAQDNDADVVVRHYQVLPERAHAEWVVHEGLDDGTRSALTEARALDTRGVSDGASIDDVLDVPLVSPIASAQHCMLESIIQADNPAARRALLDTFVHASPPIGQSLSDSVLRSPLLRRWTERAAFADLGELLVRLRPTRSSPILESSLPHAIGLAWHERRLAELVLPDAPLAPLFQVLPKWLRNLLAAALALGSFDKPAQSPAVGHVIELRSALHVAELPTGELVMNILGVVLDAFSKSAELPRDAWEESMTDITGDGVRHVLLTGLYYWLASRRPLEPLQRLEARLTAIHEFDWFPHEALASAGPREAVARLSDPERAIIRTILERYDDREGLDALALEAKRQPS